MRSYLEQMLSGENKVSASFVRVFVPSYWARSEELGAALDFAQRRAVYAVASAGRDAQSRLNNEASPQKPSASTEAPLNDNVTV